MSLVQQALRAGHANVPTSPSARTSAIVVGGGGKLGSAVLERLLASRRFAPVRVLVTRGFNVAMHGLEAVIVPSLDTPHGGARHASRDIAAGTAIVIFDRQRHANGRDAAFLRPRPEALPEIARWLHAHGTSRLIVVLPHDPAGLPEALKVGLANLDEQAVAALGFEQVVFVRSAQAPADERAARWLQRLADGVLAQLRFMVPQAAQPVRVHKVAQFAVELAAHMVHAAPGTRVAPPELVWQAAQMANPGPLVAAWLGGVELPAVHAPRMRL